MFAIDPHRFAGDELAHEAAPFTFRKLGANAKGAELVVAVLQDFVGGFAAQDVDVVARAKGAAAALLDTVHAREQLAGGFGGVEGLRWVQAVVAVAAGLGRLTKVAEQTNAAAVGGFGQRQQGIELATHDLFVAVGGWAFVNHAALVDHVL